MLHRMEEKNDFWEDLNGLIESISTEERIVSGADLNGHVGEAGTRNNGMVLEQEIRKDQWLWILGKGWIWRLSILISRGKINTGGRIRVEEKAPK